MSRCSHAQSNPRCRFVQRLSAYAATGGALVGADASAEIIYTDLGNNGVTVRDGTFDVDMNADGHVDFTLKHFHTDIFASTPSSTPTSQTDWTSGDHVRMYGAANPEFSRRVLVGEGPFAGAKAFSIDEDIPPRGRSLTGAVLATVSMINSTSNSNTQFRGEFLDLADGAFVGVLLGPTGQLKHAGWLHVEASYPDHFTIYGFAYETVPGKAIVAGAVPEPPSLVLLAAGAAGLALLRRRRSAIQSS